MDEGNHFSCMVFLLDLIDARIGNLYLDLIMFKVLKITRFVTIHENYRKNVAIFA